MVIRVLKQNEDVRNHDHLEFEFIYNEKQKTALLLFLVIKHKSQFFLKKQNRKYKSKHNKGNTARITTTDNARRAILYFLNHRTFNEFTLAVAVGSYTHEACLFLRKDDDRYKAIYYNPNFSQVTQGVQTSNTANDVLKSLGNKLNQIRSYYSESRNVAGICSFLVWKQIYILLNDGVSPFDNPNIHLENYDRLKTPYTLDKSKEAKRNKKNLNLKRYPFWKQFDEMLVDFNEDDIDEIDFQFSSIICDVLTNASSQF